MNFIEMSCCTPNGVKYKGKRKPRCCNGVGCYSCWNKYAMEHNLIFLDEWSTGNKEIYSAPEVRKIYLHGCCYGHPKHLDGTEVTTSHIVSVNGRIVKTSSGSTYVLGVPHEDFVDWLIRNNLHLPTDKEPIKVKNV